jgi:TldD protein
MFNPQHAQSVIDHALSLGADFAELFIERQLRSNVETLSGAVKDISSGIDFGIGVRLVFGFKVLYGYTNKADTNELKRIVSDLAAKDRRDPSVTATAFRYAQYANIHPAANPLSRDHNVASKIDFLLTADKAARGANDAISQVTGSVGQREQAIEIFNSEGLHATDTRHYSRARTTAIAQNGQEQATGYDDDGGLLGWELSDRMNAQAMGEEATRMALVNLGANACPSGRMPVIIGNGFGGVIFHEACGHLLETTSVAKQASVFHDKLGGMIANPVVNAVDDGTLANEWGSINIDDEGMATQNTQLIKDGQLVNFLADRQGSLKTGIARSGSGRRESYKFAPTSRMRNTFIEPGNDSFDDMIGSIEKGIYAKRMGGGSVTPGTGEFNFAVTEGYYVEDGKIQYPVKSATLISTGPQVLKEISMVSDDFKLACGMCGSVSGSVPTTVGQAALKVDDILVGGNA